jgi:hypothetical protein
MHDKDPLCRAPERKRTSKIFTHGKLGFSRSSESLRVVLTKIRLTSMYTSTSGVEAPRWEVWVCIILIIIQMLLLPNIIREIGGDIFLSHSIQVSHIYYFDLVTNTN